MGQLHLPSLQEHIDSAPKYLSHTSEHFREAVQAGYAGGDVPNATYRNHGDHAEAIEIIFDPAKLSYRKLLEFFFQVHDPTTRNRQGNDIGTSYRSAIFYTSEEQKRIAEDTIADVKCIRALAWQSRDRGWACGSILGG